MSELVIISMKASNFGRAVVMAARGSGRATLPPQAWPRVAKS